MDPPMNSPPPPYDSECGSAVSTLLPRSPENCTKSDPNYQNPKQNLSQSRRINKKREVIGCCNAATWTKSIAVFEIVFCLVYIVAVFILVPPGENEKKELPELEKFNKLGTLEKLEAFSQVVMSKVTGNLHILLVDTVMFLLLGIGLLVGTILGKPLFLLIWLVASGIGLGVCVICFLILVVCLLMGGGGFVLLLIAILFIPFGIQAFFFFVVAIHCQELKAKNKQQKIQQSSPYTAVNLDSACAHGNNDKYKITNA